MLKNKTVVIGVSGGIAVYKTLDVISRLRKLGVNVNVIMTKSATEFVTPLSFQSLSQNYVVCDMFEDPKTWDVEHVSLAKRADVFLIAPATANVIGKIANGIADDMLTTTVMATKAKVLIAPAMNTNMYNNVIVQENIKSLQSKGIYMILPASGLLACQTEGEGKMQEPDIIAEKVLNILNNKNNLSLKVENDMLSGLTILITAGPTKEYFDPVRYITNESSGKMGYALAEEAHKMGANVILISGEVSIVSDIPNIHKVVSAEDMYNAFLSFYNDADIIIMAAAVADYAPVYENIKIKKNDDELTINLKKTKDILSYAGANKKDNQILVGFAAETNNMEEYAKQKLEKKNADIIAANDVSRKDIGFNSMDNEVTLFFADGHITHTGRQSKQDIAKIILAESAILHSEKNQ